MHLRYGSSLWRDSHDFHQFCVAFSPPLTGFKLLKHRRAKPVSLFKGLFCRDIRCTKRSELGLFGLGSRDFEVGCFDIEIFFDEHLSHLVHQSEGEGPLRWAPRVSRIQPRPPRRRVGGSPYPGCHRQSNRRSSPCQSRVFPAASASQATSKGV